MIRHAMTVVAVSAFALLAAGCELGPDFLRPSAPEAKGYAPAEAPVPAETASSKVRGGEAQRFIEDRDIPGQWWTLFHSPALNSLIERALKANPTLQAAQATLRQAQENYYAEVGVFYPSVDLNASSTREKISSAQFGSRGTTPPFSVHTASVTVSYGVDVWGGERRELEALGAQVDYQRFQLEAAYLTLTSNVAVAVVQEASLRAQIEATQDIINAQTEQLQVLRQQFELGGASRAGVLAQEATVAATRATLPPLEKQLAQQRNLLAVLAGQLPSESLPETFDLAGLSLPQELPTSLPSKLVEQRPDIRAAEEQMHAANAQVGVAEVAMLPQFTLSAGYGRTALRVPDLSNPANAVWNFGAGIAAPLFHGGTLLHQKRAAEAAYDAAAAQYRSTVLTAFQNVADTLRALEADARALAAQVEAERSAMESLEMSRQQYQFGAIPYASLLDAERTYQQAHISLVQAQGNRYADTAALFQALGGGWWNRTDVAASGKP